MAERVSTPGPADIPLLKDGERYVVRFHGGPADETEASYRASNGPINRVPVYIDGDRYAYVWTGSATSTPPTVFDYVYEPSAE